jgi:hypothetical protein
MGRVAAILALVVLCTQAAAQDDATRLIAECDRLAASDMDATRPPSVPGVAAPSIDAAAALKACLAAAKAAPSDARVLFQLGRALRAAKQDQQARTAYQLADKRGNILAAINLGIMFATGAAGPRDLSEARRLYEKAAKAGHPSAIHLLADMYANGNGVPKDGAQAQRLYLQALPEFEKYAAAGSATAMFVLGGMHEHGRGTTRDVALARQWYAKALAADRLTVDLLQTRNALSGRFINDGTREGASPLSGTISGRTVRFARTWPCGRTCRQDYVLTLSADGNRLVGNFSGDRDMSVGTEVVMIRIGP